MAAHERTWDRAHGNLRVGWEEIVPVRVACGDVTVAAARTSPACSPNA